MVRDATGAKPTANPKHVARDEAPTAHPKEKRPYWPLIGTKDQIPAWLRENDFILGGHPHPTHSYWRSFRLWRCLHMETMNIWTHLLGTAAFPTAGLALYRYASAPSSHALQPSAGDMLAFGSSLTAATVCFGLITAFHTLRSHSRPVHHLWGRMDILGICTLALGGGASLTYYAFYFDRAVRRVYWALNLGSAGAAAVTLFNTGGGGDGMRMLRGGVFSLLAISAMLPLFHSAGSMGWDRACVEIGARWYLAEGVSLLVGVCVFVAGLPEKLSPGSFDIWGHSHQLFHLFAVLGTALHVVGLVAGYQYRQANPAS